MHRQKGITLTGLIIGCVVLAMLMLLGFRLAPAYMEYSTIQKTFQGMAEDPALRGAGKAQLQQAWAARATVENITSVDGALINYTKEADGWLISTEYEKKVHLFKNVSVCFDFKPSSK